MREKQIGCPNMHDPDDWTRGGECVCAELAAAEERGRRRGVEERDALRAALKELRVNVIVASCDGSCLCGSDEWLTWHNGIIDAALAPRDSAPAPGCLCRGGKTQPYCAYCLGMSGAPRDSGKENT